jgi:hypothetical protein
MLIWHHYRVNNEKQERGALKMETPGAEWSPPDDSLQSLIKDHLSEEDLAEINNLLRPFYEIAQSGEYVLSPEAECDPEKIKSAIGLAIGEEVQQIIFCSISNPFPKPLWMTEEVYQTSLSDSLGDSLSDSLRASLSDSLWDSLGASLWNSLGDSLRASLRGSLWVSLWDSLFYFLGFSMVHQKEQSSRLIPLIQIFSQCILLGKKKDEEGTWIVLCH